MRRDQAWRRRAVALGAVLVAGIGVLSTGGCTTPVGPPTTPVGAATPGANLGPNQKLLAGGALVNTPYILNMQRDGNLVVTNQKHQVLWDNGVQSPGAWLIMQQDGNLVEYSASGQALWDTGTSGAGNCLLAKVTLGAWTIQSPPSRGWPWWLWTVAPCYQGHTGPAVAIVGDSITWLSQDDVANALQSQYRMTVSGEPSWTIGQQLPALSAMLADPAGPPSDVIVNLGTNDALRQKTAPTPWQAQLNQLVTMVATEQCVVFVTVNEMSDLASGGQVAAEINQTLNQEVASHPNFHLIPWNRILSTGDNAARLLSPIDAIHPTPAGDRMLASLYAHALHNFC